MNGCRHFPKDMMMKAAVRRSTVLLDIKLIQKVESVSFGDPRRTASALSAADEHTARAADVLMHHGRFAVLKQSRRSFCDNLLPEHQNPLFKLLTHHARLQLF